MRWILRTTSVVGSALLVCATSSWAQPGLPTVTVTFVGNAQSVGAVESGDVLVSLEEGFVVGPVNCFSAFGGAPACGFPDGQACCVLPIPANTQGRGVTLLAPARRGIAGSAPGEFGGWGGACAQPARPCPVSPHLAPRKCLGGFDRRGELISGISRLDDFATFGCHLMLPSSGNVDVILHWNKFDDGPELPPACTNIPAGMCSSPPRDSTAQPTPIQCGDPTLDGVVTEVDADEALRASVGGVSCLLSVCDVNGDGDITAADGLLIFRLAAGVPTEIPIACPAP